MASAATGGWESGLQNTLSPGDKVLTWRYGQFSHLWVDMMERLGLEVQVIDAPWGAGVDEAKLAEILKADTEKKIKAVAVVHNETTTGSINLLVRQPYFTSNIPEMQYCRFQYMSFQVLLGVERRHAWPWTSVC